MTGFPWLTWALVVAALVVGILAGHFGWGKRWPGSGRLHPDYLTGLDYLVTEQPDRALDIFLKLMEANADTIETHFALGSLYRRRGEVERAIRVHQNLLGRETLAPQHREQALLALARDYLRAGVLDRAEALFQQVGEVPRLQPIALDALRGVYERQHEWRQALNAHRRLARIGAAPPGQVAAHYLCELASLALERADLPAARQLLGEAQTEAPNFPRAALLLARIALLEAQPGLAVSLMKAALQDQPSLLQEELPRLADLVGVQERESLLAELVAAAERRGPGDLKRLVFAVIGAGLGQGTAMQAAIDKLLEQDATLQAVWRAEPRSDILRVARELGALLAQAEKFRCVECGFSGQRFYWHCPACHSWDSFEGYAIVKLR